MSNVMLESKWSDPTNACKGTNRGPMEWLIAIASILASGQKMTEMEGRALRYWAQDMEDRDGLAGIQTVCKALEGYRWLRHYFTDFGGVRRNTIYVVAKTERIAGVRSLLKRKENLSPVMLTSNKDSIEAMNRLKQSKAQ